MKRNFHQQELGTLVSHALDVSLVVMAKRCPMPYLVPRNQKLEFAACQA